MGGQLRGRAGKSHAGVAAPLRCQRCCWGNILILLSNGGTGAFWELLKSRGGHPAAGQGFLTGCTGRVPV